MGKVAGKDVLALIFYNGQWRNYACGLSISMDVTTDFIETSTRGNGKSKTFTPAMDEWTATLEGVMTLEQSGLLSLPDFRDIQDAQIALLLRSQHTDDVGNIYTEEGTAYISRTTDTGAVEGAATFTIELRGTGSRTRIYTTTATSSLPVMRLEYTGVGGEDSFTDALLVGKTAIAIFIDGIEQSKLLLTGTPINKEVLFDATTGTLTFDAGNPLATGEEVAVLYQ